MKHMKLPGCRKRPWLHTHLEAGACYASHFGLTLVTTLTLPSQQTGSLCMIAMAHLQFFFSFTHLSCYMCVASGRKVTDH